MPNSGWEELGRFVLVCTLCGILIKTYSTVLGMGRGLVQFFLRLEKAVLRIEKKLDSLCSLSKGMEAVLDMKDLLAERPESTKDNGN